jgi:aspartate-semialdehyde dehydrogenase
MNEMKKNIGYKVAIFDPTSIHGKEMKKVLIERGFPYESVKLIDTEEGLGTVTEFNDEATIVTLADTEALSDSDVVFFCGNPDVANGLISRHRELDFFAFDLSRSQEESDEYRYFVSGLEIESLREWRGVYASPNPVAVPLIRFFSRLADEFGLLFASATVMNAASEDGFEGVSTLHRQTTDLLNFISIDGKQLIFNLFPKQKGYPREIEEIKKQVTDYPSLKDMEFTLSLIAVPVFFGTAAAVYVEMEKPPKKDFVWKDFFKKEEGFSYDGDVSGGDDPLGPVDIANTDLLHIQILSSEQETSRLWFWILADNIRLCSVINAVQLAEQVLEIG